MQQIALGKQELESIIDAPITCSAVAGWRADQRVVKAKEAFGFHYNSDCRGVSPFKPLIGAGTTGAVQIPVTLPTWDEVVGRTVNATEFNDFILGKMLDDPGVPVYTIHAEVEGIAFNDMFDDLLTRAAEAGIVFCPLGELLPDNVRTLPVGKIVRGELAGREGWLGCQQMERAE